MAKCFGKCCTRKNCPETDKHGGFDLEARKANNVASLEAKKAKAADAVVAADAAAEANPNAWKASYECKYGWDCYGRKSGKCPFLHIEPEEECQFDVPDEIECEEDWGERQFNMHDKIEYEESIDSMSRANWIQLMGLGWEDSNLLMRLSDEDWAEFVQGV